MGAYTGNRFPLSRLTIPFESEGPTDSCAFRSAAQLFREHQNYETSTPTIARATKQIAWAIQESDTANSDLCSTPELGAVYPLQWNLSVYPRCGRCVGTSYEQVLTTHPIELSLFTTCHAAAM